MIKKCEIGTGLELGPNKHEMNFIPNKHELKRVIFKQFRNFRKGKRESEREKKKF